MAEAEPFERTIIQNADYVVTMDEDLRVLENTSVAVNGNQITEIGDITPTRFDRVIEGAGRIVLPGLINTHHHTFQALLRGHPELQNQPINNWIRLVSGLVKQMDADMIYNSETINMAELIRYGCTTTTDMLYLHPPNRGDFFRATVNAGKEIGMRFHPYRGSVSVGESNGGLFPDDIVETPREITRATFKAFLAHNDPEPFSMTRVGAAPCNVFTSSAEDYRAAAEMSKDLSMNIQTHAYESSDEAAYVAERYGFRPLEYLCSLGWAGTRASLTHCIYIGSAEVQDLADSGMHVVHCPISNARASIGERGVAPIKELLEAGINIALGTDGSAGNDSSNIREELKWARIMPGTRRESTYLSPLTVLGMATIDAAQLLNRPEIGSLELGKAADLAIFPIDNVENAGSWDPVTGFVSNQAVPAETVMINGRLVLENGVFQTIDIARAIGNTRKDLAKLKG
jgi:8-oxoguanine deaminase